MLVHTWAVFVLLSIITACQSYSCQNPRCGDNDNRESNNCTCQENFSNETTFPHCGSDGVTYNSLELLQFTACKKTGLHLLYKSPCRVSGTYKCGHTQCPPYSFCNKTSNLCECPERYNATIYDPYCGRDGITYCSKEHLEYTSCHFKNNLQPLMKGPCRACGDPKCHPYTICDTKLNICVCKDPSHVFAPVCDVHGKSHISDTHLLYGSCKNGTNTSVRYVGYCLGPGVCGHTSCHPYTHCQPRTNKCVCDQVVDTVHEPVCGDDYNTYENIHFLQAHACHNNVTLEFLYNGTCRDSYPCGDARCHFYSYCNNFTNTCDCPSPIPGTRNTLVCSTSGKTFGSPEMLKSESCHINRDMKIKHAGECKRDLMLLLLSIFLPIVFLIVVIIIIFLIVRQQKKKSRENVTPITHSSLLEEHA